MNINYLKIDEIPKYEDGWQSVLDALSGGEFFVTTGEVLIPKFSINGKESGEIAQADQTMSLEIDLQWTYPLAYMELISGDGRNVNRLRFDLSDTTEFGSINFQFPVDLINEKWARIEVWDIARNGAFTQPIRLE